MKRKQATPLQEWARERFMLKGAISSSIGLLEQKAKQAHLTMREKESLTLAIYNLRDILYEKTWDRAMILTREKVEKSIRASTGKEADRR